MSLGYCANAKCVRLFYLPAVSEVSSSLQPSMVLFIYGEQEDKVNICSLHAQNLDALLGDSPKHPPNYPLRKSFNGEALHTVCMETWLCCCNMSSCHVSQRFNCKSLLAE